MGLLFLIFVVVPLIEIALFVQIGGEIGMIATVVIVILTAFMGANLLRAQGFSTWRHAQKEMESGNLPVDDVIHGLFLLFAGALLLTPGFLTDTIGFLLFLPPLRLFMGRKIMAKLMASNSVHMEMQGAGRKGRRRSHVIDGEFHEVDDDK